MTRGSDLFPGDPDSIRIPGPGDHRWRGSEPPFVPRPAIDLYLDSFPSAAIQTYERERDPAAPGYISASQVKMFVRCPEQFRQRYVLGRKQRPGAALVWGSADHDTHEVNFAQKLTSHKDMTIGDIETLFATKLDEKIEADGGVGEIEWSESETPAFVKDQGVRLAAMYHRLVSPSVQPTAVEESFEIPGEQLGIPIPLKGRIDLRAHVPDLDATFRVGATEASTVEKTIDRKTAGQKMTVNGNPEWVTQGRLYMLADYYTRGAMLPVEWHLSLKPGKKRKMPNVVANEAAMVLEPQPVAMIRRQLQIAVAGISFMYATYGPDEPWQGAWAGFASSCGFCGYRPECPWWQADRWKDAA